MTETIDYTKFYNPNYKPLKEMYVPEDGDEVISMNEEETIISSNGKRKIVVTEDYLVKDIRKAILSLREEDSEDAESDEKKEEPEEKDKDKSKESEKEDKPDDKEAAEDASEKNDDDDDSEEEEFDFEDAVQEEE